MMNNKIKSRNVMGAGFRLHLKDVIRRFIGINFRSTTLNSQPSTFNSQFSILNSQPSILNSQLSTLKLSNFKTLSCSKGSVLIRISLLLISIAIFVAILFIGSLILFRTSAPEITLPDVTGKVAEAARTELLHLGLVVDTKIVIAQDTEINIVLKTMPEPGTKVKAGRTVILFIGAEMPMIEVPELRGILLFEAENILKQTGITYGSEGLRLGKITQVESDSGAGIILAQEPGPGVLIKAGSIVNLSVTVEKGGEIMPNLEGLSLSEAVETMAVRGYAVEPEPYYTSAWAANTVKIQKPQPGTKLVPGVTIKLVYAASAPPVDSTENNPVTYPTITDEEEKNNENQLQQNEEGNK